MRYVILLLVLASSLAVAKDRNWQDAVFLGTSSRTAGAAAMPVGSAIVAVPLSSSLYWFKSNGITYGLRTNYTGRWPNLTVNGHTKFTVEGRTAHVLDDDNKDRKFSVITKIAAKEVEAAK